jgi:hypothetical protein
MKKFAVCFSGYPRFTEECFSSIKENLLDGLGEYDIFASFQWPKDWENHRIHHEHGDKFKSNEKEKFQKFYSTLNLKRLEIKDPFKFDTSNYFKTSAEPDLNLSLDESRDIYYRLKSQYQGIVDCINLVDDEYEYIVRMRTDLIFTKKLDFKDLNTSSIINQNGFSCGWDRYYSDWFFICPNKKIKFFEDLSDIETHFSEGIVHFHKIIYNLSGIYDIRYEDLGVETPSTIKLYSLYEK